MWRNGVVSEERSGKSGEEGEGVAEEERAERADGRWRESGSWI